jgi:CheY-like chemotaxis protein
MMVMAQRAHRVLLVDDDASVRRLCTEVLRRAGFETIEAESGRHGLDLARLNPPDLLLADILMPGLDGFELAEALRRDEATRAIPVVYLSGEREPSDRMRAHALGVAAFVTKPFDPGALVALLLGVLERGDGLARA